MSAVEKREALLHIITNADNRLTGMLFALANEYKKKHYEFTEEDIARVDESLEEYLKNPQQAYTLEASMKLTRSRFNK